MMGSAECRGKYANERAMRLSLLRDVVRETVLWLNFRHPYQEATALNSGLSNESVVSFHGNVKRASTPKIVSTRVCDSPTRYRDLSVFLV